MNSCATQNNTLSWAWKKAAGKEGAALTLNRGRKRKKGEIDWS